ncbi:MAG: MBL fold metallo-hydrolase [Candidatus Accumulibacter sp. UW27]|jgi:glyoxylase-like metal-dependent hydrolase (beta-lactamase superfamily II)
MHIEGFFDPSTGSNSYLVFDGDRARVVVVDSVLDYDPRNGRTSTGNADQLIDRIVETGADLEWILETHVHADHLSAATYLKERLGGRTGIGERVTVVQRFFGQLFNAGGGFATDGSQFDHLLVDGETILVGSLRITALHTPGHTPACVSYLFADGEEQAVFVGDTLFMPDTGTARCDFPGGDAHALYRSLRRLLALPPQTRLYLCHDYPPHERPNAFFSSVGEQRRSNIHVHDGVGEEEFVDLRRRRDATLAAPVLLLPAVQVNMRGGTLPEAEANGTRYLKIPLNVL